jgi:hypothetical protein
MQLYRLLDYSHLVSDLQQPKRPSDSTVGGVLKRQKVWDFTTDAAGGTKIDGNQVSTIPATGSNFHNRDRDVADISATQISMIATQEDSDTLSHKYR